jgi:hypothetical protein
MNHKITREKFSICGFKFSKDNDYPKHPKIRKRILGGNDYLKRAMQKSLLLPFLQAPPSKIFPSDWITREYPISSDEPMGCITIPLFPKVVSKVPVEVKRAMQKSSLPVILL